MTSAARYAIGDLARLAGVSRRTVRYYVQENVIPPPFGVGRGNHYGPEHLDRILHVKTMQEAGKSLDEIRGLPGLKPRPTYNPARPTYEGAPGRSSPGLEPGPAYDSTPPTHERTSDLAPHPERSIWRRLTLAPGVELQIAGNVRLPSPGKLQELAAWCRLHLISTTDPEDEGNDA